MPKIIRRTEPAHIAVLFDGEHENDHSVMNDDYKANRIYYCQTSADENPFSQLLDVYVAILLVIVLSPRETKKARNTRMQRERQLYELNWSSWLFPGSVIKSGLPGTFLATDTQMTSKSNFSANHTYKDTYIETYSMDNLKGF